MQEQLPAPSKGRNSPAVKRERDIDNESDHPQKRTAFGFGLKTSSVVSLLHYVNKLRFSALFLDNVS